MAVGLVEQPSSIRAIFSSPDSVGLALADVAAVAVLRGATLIAGTDAVGITIAEAAATILGLIATTDDISVQPTESGALAVTLQAGEAVTIVVADAGALIAALGIAAGSPRRIRRSPRAGRAGCRW